MDWARIETFASMRVAAHWSAPGFGMSRTVNPRRVEAFAASMVAVTAIEASLGIAPSTALLPEFTKFTELFALSEDEFTRRCDVGILKRRLVLVRDACGGNVPTVSIAEVSEAEAGQHNPVNPVNDNEEEQERSGGPNQGQGEETEDGCTIA